MMPNGLETFWRLLEMNFPFGGHRRCLQDQLGQDLVRGLLKAGLLSYRWLANSYPCDQPGGDGCPRQVVRQPDGTYRAVCGNRPSECDTIDLKAEDLEFLSTVPQDFLRGIARLLAIQPSRASETPVYHSFRVGSFIPEPGEKYPVYFVVRARRSGYSDALEALRSQHEGKPIGVLVPTEEVIGDGTIRHMQMRGVTIFALSEIIGVREDELIPTKYPCELIEQLRGRGNLLGARICAVAYARQRQGNPEKKELTGEEYEKFISNADQYDFFADEMTGKVCKPEGSESKRSTGKASATAFRMIRMAIESRGYFDPSAGEFQDRDDPVQTFRRARQYFDQRTSDGEWTLIQTVFDHSPPKYSFDPIPDVAYAFVFSQDS